MLDRSAHCSRRSLLPSRCAGTMCRATRRCCHLSTPLTAALTPRAEASRLSIALSIRGAEMVPVFPDEGLLYLRARNDISALVIRGISEEIEIRLDTNGAPISGRRRSVRQGWIARAAKYEFKSIAADLSVTSSDFNDFNGLAPLLADADVQEALGRAKEPQRADLSDEEEPSDRRSWGMSPKIRLVEEISSSPFSRNGRYRCSCALAQSHRR